MSLNPTPAPPSTATKRAMVRGSAAPVHGCGRGVGDQSEHPLQPEPAGTTDQDGAGFQGADPDLEEAGSRHGGNAPRVSPAPLPGNGWTQDFTTDLATVVQKDAGVVGGDELGSSASQVVTAVRIHSKTPWTPPTIRPPTPLLVEWKTAWRPARIRPRTEDTGLVPFRRREYARPADDADGRPPTMRRGGQ